METDARLSEDLEDGEVESEEEDEVYVPLERPQVPSSRPTPEIVSEPEDNVESSSSNSDSDSGPRKTKKLKIRKKFVCMKQTLPNSKKRNNIWCQSVQEDILTGLVKCDVDRTFDRNRDVESYNYTITPGEEVANSTSNRIYASRKRKHNRTNTDLINRGKLNTDGRNSTGSARIILELSTTKDNSTEDIAKDMANKLCEEKEELIYRAIDIIGKDIVFDLFNQTRDIEKNGGLLIMNGARRRTPGGVFFFLIRSCEDIPRSAITEVFAEDRRQSAAQIKMKAKENRRASAMKLKHLLANDDFPTLLSHTELAIKQFKERQNKETVDEEEEEQTEAAKEHTQEDPEVKNPPPSPATDGRENSDNEEHRISVNIGEVVDNKLRDKTHAVPSTDEEEVNETMDLA